MGREVRAEPSTRPVGQGSSRAVPGFDWMNPRSHPKTEKEEGRWVLATKTTQKYVMEVEMFKRTRQPLDREMIISGPKLIAIYTQNIASIQERCS